MVRKECRFKGCRCTNNLFEVTAALEDFCSALMGARFDYRQFRRVSDSGAFKAKTWLCEEHVPAGLQDADLLGTRVAKIFGGELFFGEVTAIAGFSRHVGRLMDQRVEQLLKRPPHEWRYTITWPAVTSAMPREVPRAEVLAARDLAALIDKHVTEEMAPVEAERRRHSDAAWHRGRRRAGSARDQTLRTRVVVPSYDGLLSALPTRLRRLMPGAGEFMPSPEIIGAFTTETPVGTIHHSGSGLIFDINASSAATQTDATAGYRGGFCFANMDAAYLTEHPTLMKDLFGFSTYDAAADFFDATWHMGLDEPGLACPQLMQKAGVTAFDEFLLTLWRMRKRADLTFLSCFAGGISASSMSTIQHEWIPRCGRVGRSWVWNPSVECIDACVTESFERCGMGSVGYIGDATDILTETVRKQISVRNQQRSEKSHASAAMGLSWCTQTGWTAMASDLVLARSSEYNTAVAIAEQFASVPPRIALCYDKGVASLRAHLPNLNNVIVPCFLTGGKYTAEQAVRNRAIATNRYVIEVTYRRVKTWDMVSPVVPRGDFIYLNHIWWWALGFANLTMKPLKRPGKSVCI